MLLRRLLLVALAGAAPPALASVPAVPFTDCAAAPSASSLRISTVYAQVTPQRFLNLTLLGESPAEIRDVSDSTNLLSTVFAPTNVLTFLLNPDNESRFCATIRPPSPLQNVSNNYCPLQPGPFAFSVATRLTHSYELMTLNTRIRVVDTSSPAQEIACVQVAVTPLTPRLGSVYGHAVIVFWVSVALAIAFWLVVGAGRLAAAWKRGRQRVHNNLWSRVQGTGFVLASAISGERFASSPALLRFGTPSLRDVIFHTQWCTLLGMVTVQWPRFTYPYFAQTAWATLLYNVTLTQGDNPDAKHWDPLHADPFSPPAIFADQLADAASPLYINATIPNSLFSLPPDAPQTGIPALAAAVGIRAQDAFGIAVGLFLLILGATIVLSILIFVIDFFVGSLIRAADKRKGGASGTRTPPWSSGSNKEFADSPEPVVGDDELASATGTVRFHRPPSRTMNALPAPTGWLSHRLGQSSFHGSVLHGNLVRILILFHLPVTIFSCFQFAEGKSHSSLAAVILAALSFAVFSIAIPAWLVIRLTTTPTNKLYDETRTLLALGPLYNHYAHGSQLFACLFFTSNIAYGVALGCGQQSGSAQAIIILVVEVASALTTSVWLPWGRGAAMGGISFMLCVARIITAVLLVILSPIVSVGDDAGGWIAYAILFIQALVYLALLLMLACKLAEGLVRLAWDVSFDRSKHTVDTGLLGAVALAGCCGPRKHKHKRPARARAASDATTQNMLPLPPAGPPSVLRPEQLTAPYREESDDEGGYILGAWHYEEEDAPPASPVASASAGGSGTGFRRVAGGRANLDAPYTMALPPGAMAPGARRESLVQPALADADAAQDASLQETEAPGRRARWRGLFGARGAAEAAPMLAAEEPPRSAGGSSFVVIRERRPSPLSQQPLTAEEAEGSAASTSGPRDGAS